LTAARFDSVDETNKDGPIQGIVDSFIYITAIVIPILQHELVWGNPHFSQCKPNLRKPPEDKRRPHHKGFFTIGMCIASE
jgi:hypothetical protein